MNSISDNSQVLLQHARTRLFFIRDGDWTSNPAQARNFGTAHAALIYSRALGMPEAEPVHFLPHDASHQCRAAA